MATPPVLKHIASRMIRNLRSHLTQLSQHRDYKYPVCVIEHTSGSQSVDIVNFVAVQVGMGGMLCLLIVFYWSSSDQTVSNFDATDSSSTNNHKIRVICISDTHNGYDSLTAELTDLFESDADVLVHAGDMTETGQRRELEQINEWFGTLPFKREHIITISGNMDGIGLDSANIDGHDVFTNAVYLEHESYEIEDIGLRIFASPWTPRFVGGFQLMSDHEAAQKWQNIPEVDLLLCHGPPHGILDSTSRGKSIGDEPLMRKIDQIKPKAVVFGHVHASFGRKTVDGIQFVNAAQFNGIYDGQKTVKPILLEL